MHMLNFFVRLVWVLHLVSEQVDSYRAMGH
jgi:hypothetical protein